MCYLLLNWLLYYWRFGYAFILLFPCFLYLFPHLIALFSFLIDLLTNRFNSPFVTTTTSTTLTLLLLLLLFQYHKHQHHHYSNSNNNAHLPITTLQMLQIHGYNHPNIQYKLEALIENS